MGFCSILFCPKRTEGEIKDELFCCVFQKEGDLIPAVLQNNSVFKKITSISYLQCDKTHGVVTHFKCLQ